MCVIAKRAVPIWLHAYEEPALLRDGRILDRMGEPWSLAGLRQVENVASLIIVFSSV
jgi:hypothetical protein